MTPTENQAKMTLLNFKENPYYVMPKSGKWVNLGPKSTLYFYSKSVSFFLTSYLVIVINK